MLVPQYRVFDWLSKVPAGHEIASRLVALPKEAWTWTTLGELSEEHFMRHCGRDKVEEYKSKLTEAYGAETLPSHIALNPFPFFVLPSGPGFARHVTEQGLFEVDDHKEVFDRWGREVRYWLYSRALYRTEAADPPILSL